MATPFYKNVSLILIAVAFLLHPARSLSEQYNFINYTIEDGLAQSQVIAINQDNQGYLWIGTLGGISRFDGNDFVNFSTANGIIDNQINTVYKCRDGKIWVGTLGGIVQINGASIKNYELKNEYAGLNVTCFTQNTEGILYFGTDGGFLFKVDPNTKTHEGLPTNPSTPLSAITLISKELPSNKIRSLYLDQNEKLWIGTKKGIAIMQNNKLVKVPKSFANLNVSQIMPDEMGYIWIATFGQGIIRVDSKTMETTLNLKSAKGLASDWVRSMVLDKQENIWVATKSGLNKISRYANNNESHLEIKRFSTSYGLPTNNLRCVAADNEGNLWLGTDGKGLLKFTGEYFASYSSNDGLSGDIVMSVVEDKDNNLWFSTYGNGITKFDGDKRTYYTVKNGLSNNTVWCSIRDKANNLWFGTSNGLVQFNGIGFKTYHKKEGLATNKITALEECRNGDLWVGCSRGISKISGSEIISFTAENGFIWKNSRAILEDRNGLLWIGTAEGLIQYDGDNFTIFSEKTGLCSNTIYSLEEDDNGNLWVGTKSGLVLYNGIEFKPLLIEPDFRSNVINFLELDNDNCLWIGTNNGIYNLRLKDYYANKDLKFNHFTNWEGITSLETNLNGSYQDMEGNLWFCTSNGVVRHNPGKFSNTSALDEPFINITKVGLFHETDNWKNYTADINPKTGLPNDLSIKYNKNHFTFHYAGISFANPTKVKYQYQLKGFETDWAPVTGASFATYSNLPPGEYTFMVKAKNKNELWSTHPASFSFTILAPFWTTWWFYSLFCLALASSGYLIYIWRTRINKRNVATQRLLQRSKMLVLEQKSLNANMNRHFIFNALNSIQYYINKEDKKAANDYLTSFAKLIRKNLDDANQNLVSLAEELERLELYLSLEHMRFEDKFNYEIKIDKDLNAESIKIPSMILQPFVENSIKHGILPLDKKGEVYIHIRKNDNDQLVFGIKDNGIGIEKSLKNKFPTQRKHVSKGMHITRNRLALLKKLTNKNFHITGPEVIKDNHNNTVGTKVEITLPINYN